MAQISSGDEFFVAKTLVLTSELEALKRQAELAAKQPLDQTGCGKESGTEDSDFVPQSAELLGHDGRPEENPVNPVSVPIAEPPSIEDEGPEIHGKVSSLISFYLRQFQ